MAELRRMGRRVVMITGDARQVAESAGVALGFDEFMAEVLPEDKDAKVAELQAGPAGGDGGRRGQRRPALARADVGIAIGAGTDVAMESAGVVLASNDPRAVVSVIRLSQASYRKIDPEPGLGRRLQHPRHPPGRGCVLVGRHHPVAGRRGHPHERLDHRRRPQCPAPAAYPAPTRDLAG